MEIKDNRFILVVTGGIASGKTTVSKMLEELGAHLNILRNHLRVSHPEVPWLF